MLRKILIPLDSSQYTDVAVKVAVDMANDVRDIIDRDAVVLIGLGIVDSGQIPAGRFATVVPREQIISESREEVERLMADFREKAHSMGIPKENIVTHYAEGTPFQKIMDYHVFSDLVVMGEKCSFLPDTQDYVMLEKVFHQSSRPIIVTKSDHREIKTVIMAMDCTSSSSRMMYSYAHLDPFPKAKLLLTHSREEEKKVSLDHFFESVGEFLDSYKFDYEHVRLEGDLFKNLPALVKERGAGAIALGIHQEHFLDILRKPMHLAGSPVEKLLEETGVVLYTVH